MYEFKVIKSEFVEQEEYEMALSCAREAAESILDNSEITVEIGQGQLIVKLTEYSELHELPYSFEECSEKLKGAFVDSNQRLFPEFKRIKPNKCSTPAMIPPCPA